MNFDPVVTFFERVSILAHRTVLSEPFNEKSFFHKIYSLSFDQQIVVLGLSLLVSDSFERRIIFF